VLVPFPHTRAFEELNRENRIFSHDWDEYTADRVVFHPKQMTPEKLQELFYYGWDSFYRDESQEFKMFKLLRAVTEKEAADQTYQPRRRDLASRAFGKETR
jgi:radical SAM superfamily enzyme YgiQ (UPF0313 family)